MNRARISNLFGKITVVVVICFFSLPVQGKYGGGSGTADDPYLIYDANQMNTIGADQSDWEKHFKLMADIDLVGFTGTSFNIIGTDDRNPFGGVFDGNGHTISNFSYASASKDWIGLFGCAYWGAEIKDLGLIDPNVDAGMGNNAGALVGMNRGNITNCYVKGGGVSGDPYIGGLVGENYKGMVIASFWDIETSGLETSDGGVGLTTAEMQMQITFTDAGWDFVGETVNGIEDIWFIGQGDYPRLWWEGMQVPMKLTPGKLNCRSEGNWVKAHLTLPEGFTVADVDPDIPAVLHSFGFQSGPLYVFINKDKLVEIEAAFERQAVCSLTGNWPEDLTVAGFLADGNIFLGTSTVRIIHPGMKVIEDLAWYWLNTDCVQPDFCDGIDMNRDSLVNLPDYALLMNTNVEFVTDE